MNTNDFFLKNYVLKKEKTLMFFGKEIKWKVKNKDALLSGRNRHTSKNYITT